VNRKELLEFAEAADPEFAAKVRRSVKEFTETMQACMSVSGAAAEIPKDTSAKLLTVSADELLALKSGDYRYIPASKAAVREDGEQWSWTRIYDAVVDDVFRRLAEMRNEAAGAPMYSKRLCVACATEIGVDGQMYTYKQWIAERERAVAAEDRLREVGEVLDRCEVEIELKGDDGDDDWDIGRAGVIAEIRKVLK
jgi:hypothetical protein